MSSAPYTPAVHAGGWIAVSGQVPLRDGAFLSDRPFGEQVDGVLANVADRLAEHGATLADVVKTTVFLTDMADYPLLNERWVATFPEPRPARSCVAVAGLPFDVRLEVEAWALAP
ncbi:MAG TPA: RidA family protein [Acidimicrobiales bacterium]|nr:RidA family protein [Acidimicrobiales bacterium]